MVSNNYTPYSGGVVSALDAMIPALQEAGHEVTLITIQFLNNHADDPSWVVRLPTCMRFFYKKNHIAIPWRPDHYMEQEIARLAPDIIHSHHPFLLGKSALKAAKKLGIPLVFTYHTMYERYAHYVPFPQIITVPIIKNLARNYCAQVNGVIIPSHAIAEYVQSQLDSVTSKQMSYAIIPSGLLPVFISSEPCNKKRISGEPFRLLTVGRFVPEKNMSVLLDLFSQLDQSRFSFTLIGYGLEFEHLRAYAYQKLNLSPVQVHFIFKPEKVVLAQEYRAADLFLFSSTTDTQGLVLAEAMAAGTSVIAFDGPGQRDIVRDGVNGFLVASATQMREKIERIAQDPGLRERLGVGAQETARSYYPEQTVSRLSLFYSQVCTQALEAGELTSQGK
jgi:glycosyltransferase involved in cell wall biosynthesis